MLTLCCQSIKQERQVKNQSEKSTPLYDAEEEARIAAIIHSRKVESQMIQNNQHWYFSAKPKEIKA